uniref:Helitron helicase-like domain-containing protein n=1 Tax=Plectus sambesii TaxID=2011161 RepID=A0A914V112_9BILA
MAICQQYGKPDIFLTFTCNPTWNEITRELSPSQTPSDRPDIVGKVFKVKLKNMLHDLLHQNILGKVIAYTWVIEFQKRGLPHCHMLLVLDKLDKPRESEMIDKIVQAEIPSQVDYPRLFRAVGSFMIHGPCGDLNRNSPCMEVVEGGDEKHCSKDFPKPFVNETSANVDGYPKYRRRENGVTMKVGRYELDNQWVVPYNPYLLLKYNAHINIEICLTVKSFKYLYKYIFKGHDCARIRYQNAQEVLDWDEITQYIDSRYVSAPKAFWRLSTYDMQDKSHTIVRLAVHLPDEQQIYFHEGAEQEATDAAQEKNTTLTTWFKLNQQDPTARAILYHDIPICYLFDQSTKQWKLRSWQQSKPSFGRMYTVSPSDQERYFLRLLLLHTPGAKGFDDLRQANGEMCQTFHDAAWKRGLLKSDEEWPST